MTDVGEGQCFHLNRVSVASLIVEVESFPTTPNSTYEVSNGKNSS